MHKFICDTSIPCKLHYNIVVPLLQSIISSLSNWILRYHHLIDLLLTTLSRSITTMPKSKSKKGQAKAKKKGRVDIDAQKHSIFNSTYNPLSMYKSIELIPNVTELRKIVKTYVSKDQYREIKNASIDVLKPWFLREIKEEHLDPVEQNNKMYEKVVVEIPKKYRGNSEDIETMYFSITDVIGDGNCGWYSLEQQGFFDYSRLPHNIFESLKKSASKSNIGKKDCISQHREAISLLIHLFLNNKTEEQTSTKSHEESSTKSQIQLQEESDLYELMRFHFELEGYLFTRDEESEGAVVQDVTDDQTEENKKRDLCKEIRDKRNEISRKYNRAYMEPSLLTVLSYMFRKRIILIPFGGWCGIFDTMKIFQMVLIQKKSAADILESSGYFGMVSGTVVDEVNTYLKQGELQHQSHTKNIHDDRNRHDRNALLFDNNATVYMAHVYDIYPFDDRLHQSLKLNTERSTLVPEHFNILKKLTHDEVEEVKKDSLFVQVYSNSSLKNKKECISTLVRKKYDERIGTEMSGRITFKDVQENKKYDDKEEEEDDHHNHPLVVVEGSKDIPLGEQSSLNDDKPQEDMNKNEQTESTKFEKDQALTAQVTRLSAEGVWETYEVPTKDLSSLGSTTNRGDRDSNHSSTTNNPLPTSSTKKSTTLRTDVQGQDQSDLNEHQKVTKTSASSKKTTTNQVVPTNDSSILGLSTNKNVPTKDSSSLENTTNRADCVPTHSSTTILNPLPTSSTKTSTTIRTDVQGQDPSGSKLHKVTKTSASSKKATTTTQVLPTNDSSTLSLSTNRKVLHTTDSSNVRGTSNRRDGANTRESTTTTPHPSNSTKTPRTTMKSGGVQGQGCSVPKPHEVRTTLASSKSAPADRVMIKDVPPGLFRLLDKKDKILSNPTTTFLKRNVVFSSNSRNQNQRLFFLGSSKGAAINVDDGASRNDVIDVDRGETEENPIELFEKEDENDCLENVRESKPSKEGDKKTVPGEDQGGAIAEPENKVSSPKETSEGKEHHVPAEEKKVPSNDSEEQPLVASTLAPNLDGNDVSNQGSISNEEDSICKTNEEREIISLKDKVSSLEAEVRSLKKQVETQNHQISSLRTDLTKVKSTMKSSIENYFAFTKNFMVDTSKILGSFDDIVNTTLQECVETNQVHATTTEVDSDDYGLDLSSSHGNDNNNHCEQVKTSTLPKDKTGTISGQNEASISPSKNESKGKKRKSIDREASGIPENIDVDENSSKKQCGVVSVSANSTKKHEKRKTQYMNREDWFQYGEKYFETDNPDLSTKSIQEFQMKNPRITNYTLPSVRKQLKHHKCLRAEGKTKAEPKKPTRDRGAKIPLLDDLLIKRYKEFQTDSNSIGEFDYKTEAKKLLDEINNKRREKDKNAEIVSVNIGARWVNTFKNRMTRNELKNKK